MRDITLRSGIGKEMNVRVDERQRIKDTLKVLEDNKKLESIGDMQKIYSVRKQQYINCLLTYEQAGIYNGDRLWMERDSY